MNNILSILLNKFLFRKLLNRRLGRVGNAFKIGFRSTVINPQNIFIGSFFFTGPFFYMSTNKHTSINIGDSVMFGPDCKVIAGNHNMEWAGGHMMDAPQRENDKGVIVEDGVWVGSNAILLDGSCVSEGAVVAAGAVVAGYIPPYVIAMGVPANRFKMRFNKDNLREVLENVNSNYSVNSIYEIYRNNGVLMKERY